jgi:hypothetical protein
MQSRSDLTVLSGISVDKPSTGKIVGYRVARDITPDNVIVTEELEHEIILSELGSEYRFNTLAPDSAEMIARTERVAEFYQQAQITASFAGLFDPVIGNGYELQWTEGGLSYIRFICRAYRHENESFQTVLMGNIMSVGLA